MIAKIVELIIQEAKARPDTLLPLALRDVNADVFQIITRLSSHIEGISHLDIPEHQQRIFIDHLLTKPIY